MSTACIVIMAFATGVVGTSVGALASFIICGLAGIVGIAGLMFGPASWSIVGDIAFGAYLGVQYGFGPAAVASQYAWRRGYLAGDHDIATPLIQTKKGDVLLVGGIFAVLAYFISQGLGKVFTGPIALDTTALTIALEALIGKVIFCGTLFGKVADGKKRFALDGPAWLPYCTSRTGHMMILNGVAIGITSGAIVWGMCTYAAAEGNPLVATWSILPIWCFAAMFLLYHVTAPTNNLIVHHHIGLTSAYAAKMAFDCGGQDWQVLLWGGAFGIFACYMGDWVSKLNNNSGPGYVDPPAYAIAVASIFPLGILPALGVNSPENPAFIAVPAILLAVLVIYGLICEQQAKKLPA